MTYYFFYIKCFQELKGYDVSFVNMGNIYFTFKST